jgi:hypothetical protein
VYRYENFDRERTGGKFRDKKRAPAYVGPFWALFPRIPMSGNSATGLWTNYRRLSLYSDSS